MTIQALPRVCVGLITYNSMRDLPEVIAGMQAQDYPSLQIIILDNVSQDDSVKFVQKHAPLAQLIVNSVNVGFARGHNQILAQAQLGPDDYYLALNADLVLAPNYVTRLVEALRQNQADWGIGKLYQMDEQGQPTRQFYSVGHAMLRGGYAVNIGKGLDDEGQFEVGREVFGAPGAAVLISQKLIATVAPTGELFDADMFFYSEDTDLDWRARLQGFKCWYAPTAVGYHRGSLRESLNAQGLGNRYLSVIKNAFGLDLLVYNVPLILIHCVLRLIITPKRGWIITRKVVTFAPRMWRKRRKPAVTRAYMLAWFQWGTQQASAQPITMKDRLRSFGRKLKGR
ncbi:MAG: glycosyltransferase family 2 protein [Chloroflexi bacterium]|nr:glycosyltransferase family 2 protein [Chloroflexota bacterium]